MQKILVKNRALQLFILAGIVQLCALQAEAASFALPESAEIEVRPFIFPASIANENSDFPNELQDRLIFALQKRGFSINIATAAGPSPRDTAPFTVAPEKNQLQENSLHIFPLQDTETTFLQDNAPGQEETSEQLILASGSSASYDTQTLPTDLVNNFPSGYTLSGRVTLVKMNLGNPTRIAGNIRIRAEAGLHCAYTIKESASGNVLVSDAVSISATSVTAANRDLDEELAVLFEKVMEDSAAKIAARLSGGSTAENLIEDERSYYQDSPGKRLKTAEKPPA